MRLENTCTCMEVRKLGMAFGFAFATLFFIFGIASMFIASWATMAEDIAQVYVGYSASLMGSVIGALWGFAEGFILGTLIALFYNKL